MSLWFSQVQKENLIQLSNKNCLAQVQEGSALLVESRREVCTTLNPATPRDGRRWRYQEAHIDYGEIEGA